jgi:hypothetical protein
MDDSMIIWKFLTREYTDKDQVIYLYVCGNVRSSQRAIDQVVTLTKKVFAPSMNDHFIKTVVVAYLNYKRKQYLNSEITVKPIYGH